MADEGLHISLRLALYLSLASAFGLALFACQALQPPQRAGPIARGYRRAIGVCTALAMVLSVGGLVRLVLAMTGADSYGALTLDSVAMVLSDTAAGMAWGLRMLALLACVVLLCLGRGFGALLAPSGVALATLAWTGHAAMHQGLRGYLHLGADIMHLGAAGAWLGALLGLLMMARPGLGTTELLGRASSAFARLGTCIVATLVLTGAVNYAMIAGPSLQPLWSTDYGRMLLVKLGFFAGMLALAAANRFRLSPALQQALAHADQQRSASLLRSSLLLETGLAVLVLTTVAWLGVMSPA